MLVSCTLCLYQPTSFKPTQRCCALGVLLHRFFLTCLHILQAGGYSSPSVYGYGYGYSSPSAPAATPLFGKFYSLVLASLVLLLWSSCNASLGRLPHTPVCSCRLIPNSTPLQQPTCNSTPVQCSSLTSSILLQPSCPAEPLTFTCVLLSSCKASCTSCVLLTSYILLTSCHTQACLSCSCSCSYPFWRNPISCCLLPQAYGTCTLRHSNAIQPQAIRTLSICSSCPRSHSLCCSYSLRYGSSQPLTSGVWKRGVLWTISLMLQQHGGLVTLSG